MMDKTPWKTHLKNLDGFAKEWLRFVISATVWTIFCAVMSYNDLVSISNGNNSTYMLLATTTQIMVTLFWAWMLYRQTMEYRRLLVMRNETRTVLKAME